MIGGSGKKERSEILLTSGHRLWSRDVLLRQWTPRLAHQVRQPERSELRALYMHRLRVPLKIGPRPLVPLPWTFGPTEDWSQTIGPSTLDYWSHCRLVPDHWSLYPGLLVLLKTGPRPLVPLPWTIGPTEDWSQTIGPSTLDYWSY